MLNKLERKFGKYAINNLMLYVIGGYMIGYLLSFGSRFTGVDYISYLTLEPYEIITGFQFWRIFTWVIIPPTDNIIFVLIMFVLYYQLGNALENSWGAFRFNVYIFGGMLMTLIGSFLVYIVYFLATGNFIVGINNSISTNYINLSIFLAFAVCFPDMQLLLYFIIPVKMKWMAIFYCVIIGYDILTSLAFGQWWEAFCIIASLLNFLIFFLSTKNLSRVNPSKIHRKQEYRKTNYSGPTHYRDGSPIARHKCAICGATEITHPELDFRFCSKCNGNYEYCSNHLFTHTHVK